MAKDPLDSQKHITRLMNSVCPVQYSRVLRLYIFCNWHICTGKSFWCETLSAPTSFHASESEHLCQIQLLLLPLVQQEVCDWQPVR